MNYSNLFGTIEVGQGGGGGFPGGGSELKATGTDGKAAAIPQPVKRGRGRPPKSAGQVAASSAAETAPPAAATPPAAAAQPPATAAKPGNLPAGGLVELRAALYAALGKIAEKETDRNAIGPTETPHDIKLHIAAEINGHKMREEFAAELSVGHDSERASSATPKINLVIGHIVGMLNAATRAKVLAELPEIFAANDGDLPEVSKEVADSVESMLKRLRATKTQAVKGSVSCRHSRPARPGLRVTN